MQAFSSLIQPEAPIELSKTWVDQNFDGKKQYYRLDDSCLSFAERISQFAIVLFKTIATCGLALAFSAVRSQWREVLWNKREICILTEEGQPTHQTSGGGGNLFDPQVEYFPRGQFETLLDSFEGLSNSPILDFSDRELQMVPDNMENLSHLQELWLNNNYLRTIPDSIGNLSNLRKLGFGNNYLETIPDSLGNLSNLRNLTFHRNCFETIPDSIGDLSNLLILSLADNQLQTVPDSLGNLSNLRDLWLHNNQLQIIPECLFRLHQECGVHLEGNPLNQETIEQLRARVSAEGYQGPQFTFSIREERRLLDQPQDLSASLFYWCDNDCKQVLLERLSLEQQNSLFLWLSRLEDTADYRAGQRAVKDKVKHLLTWLAEETNDDHLQPAHQILEEATGTCGDRVALSLNTLSLHVRLCKSQELGLEELKDLIIGLDRYERLEKIAEQKCGQLRAVDPIEVHLCYQIHLKDALGLPIETNHMLYERLSGVSEADIEGAQQQILAETGPGQQMAILLEHPIWKKALENSPDFEKTKEACQQQKDEAQSQVNTTYYEAAAAFYQEFQEKDKTVWNPYYLLTQQIIEPKKLSHLLD